MTRGTWVQYEPEGGEPYAGFIQARVSGTEMNPPPSPRLQAFVPESERSFAETIGMMVDIGSGELVPDANIGD